MVSDGLGDRGYYILDADGNPLPVADVLEWGAWFETADRHVAYTEVAAGVAVSTVFLALDHAFGDGPPILWETMIFGGPRDGAQWRYASREEAVEGHERASRVALEVREG
jgi:hypothetical protein